MPPVISLTQRLGTRKRLVYSLAAPGAMAAFGTARFTLGEGWSPADNLYVVLTARNLNPQMHIVARAADSLTEPSGLARGVRAVVKSRA